MILRYAVFWLALAVLAIVNGVLRGSTYGRYMSELAAHQISTLTGIVLTGTAVWFFHRHQPTASIREAWLIGSMWLAMTIVFEFGFGHFFAGHSWERLFADYDLRAGRVWSLFLLWILVMPPLFHSLSRTR